MSDDIDDYKANLDRNTASNHSIGVGKPMEAKDHPANSVPPATQDHQGTQLGTTWDNDTWAGRIGAIGRAMSGRPGYGPEYGK